MGRPKKIIQATGKIQNEEFTTLDQILANASLSKYGTTDLATYQLDLDQMSRTDLERECRKYQVVYADDNVERTRKNLISAFTVYTTYLKKPAVEAVKPIKVSKDIEKILAGGR